MNMVNSNFQYYSNKTTNQHPLSQLISTWEIDSKIFTSIKAENKLNILGVCINHYNFNQNKLHKPKLK